MVVRMAKIADAEARHNLVNTKTQQRLDVATTGHTNITEIYPQVISINSGGACPTCSEPIVLAYNKVLKRQQEYCSECINALRLDSVKHPKISGDPADEICIKCDVKEDGYGFIVAGLHQYISRTDLEAFITAGRVTYDTRTHEIFIADAEKMKRSRKQARNLHKNSLKPI